MQSLLDGYLEEQKKLIAKLEKGNVKPEDKKTIMAVIKDIAKAIDRYTTYLAIGMYVNRMLFWVGESMFGNNESIVTR